MQVDLKRLKPLGVVLVLGCAVLAFIVCLTADMGVPEKYESLHPSQYYKESADTLDELVAELEDNVFPNLTGIVDYRADYDTMTVVVTTDKSNEKKVRAVLERDFGQELFTIAAED